VVNCRAGGSGFGFPTSLSFDNSAGVGITVSGKLFIVKSRSIYSTNFEISFVTGV
jgi:hypothetical protein